MHRLPLEGIRVTDFTWMQAGPQATQYLAVMGAEVIKIESRRRLDLMRKYPLRGSVAEPSTDMNSVFAVCNCSKKSCTLNLSKPRAVEMIKEIIKISDIVVENFAPGAMERLGLGYLSLKQVKPDIIMLSISGLGGTGPEKSYLAYAGTAHALSGLTSLTGYLNGSPTTVGAFWGDHLAALNGAFVLLASLHHRQRTGEGQHIDLSMSEEIVSLIPEAIMDYTMNQRVREPIGNRDENVSPHGCYHCRGEDEWVAIAVENEEEWGNFCQAIGNPAWTREERFSTGLNRWQNQDELDKLIHEWTINYSAYEVMEILQKAGIAAGPSLSVEQLVNEPHLKERDFHVEIDHLKWKGYFVRLPWRLDKAPEGNYQRAPLLGEHNNYVLGQLLGISDKEIARLIEEQVVY